MAYVIFSPHIDDAMLSMGGVIWELTREEECVQIKYVFSVSNWTNPDGLANAAGEKDAAAVTGLRKAEEACIQHQLNYQCDYFDFPDAPLRNPADRRGYANLVLGVKRRVFESIGKDDVCFFPMGVDHPDHIVMREIGKEVCHAGYHVRFYEDMPYLASGAYNRCHFYRDNLAKGFNPECRAIDFARKSDLLKNYASQVSLSWLADINNYSYSLHDDRYYERWWVPKQNRH